jgi:peptidoglycan/xylan/chitin deacetylase (PgdA/CDA1 family)
MVGPSKLRRSAPEGSCAAVLMYHRVADLTIDTHGLAVPTEEFQRQLAHLREQWRPWPLADLVDSARAGTIPVGAVALTFDDGYVDNFTTASPLLEAAGLPATFFPTTEELGRNQDYGFWWDLLERALLGSLVPTRALTVDFPGGVRAFPMKTANKRRATHAAIHTEIVSCSAADRDAAIVSVRRQTDIRPDPASRRMRPEEIRELASRPGHAIGAHTVRHLMLPRQEATVVAAEILDCRRTLEALLDRPVTTFAYPFGAATDATVAAVGDAGFVSAFTCEKAVVRPRGNPLYLPRLDVTHRGQVSFEDWLARCLATD